jgi:hypothetical protein
MKFIPDLHVPNLDEPLSTSTSSTSVLTLFTLKELLEKFEPKILYYGECPIEAGYILYVKKGKIHPEYIMINPIDLDHLKKIITWRRFVNLREYVPDYTKLAKSVEIEPIWNKWEFD